MKVLTDSGLTTFWNKIKSYVSGSTFNASQIKLSSGKTVQSFSDDTSNYQTTNDSYIKSINTHLSTTDAEITSAKSRLDAQETFKAQQTQKNTQLDTNMANLNTRDDQIDKAIKAIAATGGASTADAVTYDKSSSGLVAATVQGAIDELQSTKIALPDDSTAFTANSKIGISQYSFTTLCANTTVTTEGWKEGSGSEFENVIEKCLTFLSTNINSYIPGKLQSFKTYWHKNSSGNEQYIYVNFYGIGTEAYRSIAIFDFADRLVYQSRQYGSCLFRLENGNKIYISGEHFYVTPKYGVTTINRNTLIKNIINKGKIQVTNWGDSLTEGTGRTNHEHLSEVLSAIKSKGYPNLNLTSKNDITYSIMMQNLLGDDYSVTNCGVGGENINTIATRTGANLVYPSNSFLLPADESTVNIGNMNKPFMSSWGTNVYPLLQGHGNSVNPCFVNGVECVMDWTGTSYADKNGMFTIKRTSPGDSALNISADTPIFFSGAKLATNTKLAVIWCYQNKGYSSIEELVEKLKKIVNSLGTKKYLVIGIHSGTKLSLENEEKALESAFGSKFFNWRQYSSTYALYDFGISPTTNDLSSMSAGSIPQSLLYDSVHLNSAGYAIIGFKIIERFKILGYI